MIENLEELKNYLFENQDKEYRDFHCRLIPNIDSERVIGVRTPVLRKLAREFSKQPASKIFLDTLPHDYYEENNLHGLIVSQIKDFDRAVYHLNRFLPYVDNWATCDIISPKVFKTHTEALLKEIRVWINSNHTYTVRFAVGMLMSFYLEDNFREEYADMVAKIKTEEYYINMMCAWYFATALAKNYEQVLPYLKNQRLEKWVHNKTIQKAVESYRITPEQKIFLKTLKLK